jgi:hypothetical protein
MVDSGHFPSPKLGGASNREKSPEHDLLNVCLLSGLSVTRHNNTCVRNLGVHAFDLGLRKQRMSPWESWGVL